MIEGPPKVIKRGPVSKRLDLETIPEVTSSNECDESVFKPTPQEELCGQVQTQSMNLEGIPEVDEQHARELWDAVHKNAVENWSNDNVSPPFSEMNLEPPMWDEVDPNVSKG